jgi:hypothetical protein
VSPLSHTLLITSPLAGGTFSYPTLPGLAASPAGNSLTLRGSVPLLAAALPLVSFLPPRDYFGDTSLSFAVARTDAPGVPLLAVSYPLAVAAVNDAPELDLPALIRVPEDAAALLPPILLSDADAHPGVHTLSLSISRASGAGPPGELSLPAAYELEYLSGAGGAASLTARGSYALVAAALAEVTFTPAPDFTAARGGALVLEASVIDHGAPASATGVARAVVVVESVNDAPELEVSLPGSILEDAALPLPVVLRDADADDPDGGGLVLSVGFDGGEVYTVPSPYPGALLETAEGSATLKSSLGTLQKLLGDGALVYRPAANFAGAVTLTFSVSDHVAATAPLALSLVVKPVNDPPALAFAAAALSTPEDTALPLPSLLSLSDADFLAADLSPSARLTVSLSVSAGALALSPPAATAAALLFTLGEAGAPSPALVLAGALPDLQAALAHLSFEPAKDFAGLAVLEAAVNDQGNTGGGPLSDEGSATIEVTAVNDAAVLVDDIAGAGAAKEGVAFPLGESLEILDADEDELLTLECATDGLGHISFSEPASSFPLQYLVPPTSAGFTAKGHISSLNSLLSSLQYTPPVSKEHKNMPRTIFFTLTDGALPPSTHAVLLPTTPVEHAAKFTLPSSLATPSSSPLPLPAIPLSDADLDDADAVHLSLSADHGELTAPAAADAEYTLGSPGAPAPALEIRATLKAANEILAQLTCVCERASGAKRSEAKRKEEVGTAAAVVAAAANPPHPPYPPPPQVHARRRLLVRLVRSGLLPVVCD